MLKEQRRDQGQIQLDGHPGGRFGKKMAAAQNAFDPAEEQFNGPAAAVNGSHQFGRGDFQGQISDQKQVLIGGFDLDQAQTHAALLLVCPQAHPGMADHSRGLIFRAQGQFFFAVNHGVVLNAKNKEGLGLVDLTEKLVVLAIVTVSLIGLPRHAHLAQGLAFTSTAFGDARIHRFVFRHMKAQMQAHSFGVTLGADAVLRPAHAGQRAPQAAVLRHQIQMPQPRIGFLRAQSLSHDFAKNLVKQSGVEHVLHFGKAAQADVAATNLLLDTGQFGDGAEPAHAFDHPIAQSKKKQEEVRTITQFPARIGKGRVQSRFGEDALHDVLKDPEHIPVFQVFSVSLRSALSTRPIRSGG